tara:strand:+ start:348 stop:518 length:171 start_codon:yes stop_codon:yes gene_type:complete
MASPNTLRIMAEKNKVKSKRYMAWVSVVVDPDAKTQTKGKTFKKGESVLTYDEMNK